MKKSGMLRAGCLWLAGAVCFVLRIVQLRSCFDPVTGLALPGSDPAALPGKLLWLLLLACIAVEAALCFRRPKGGKRSFSRCFDGLEPPALRVLCAGSFLLCAGGGLLLVSALPPRGAMGAIAAAAGVLGIAGGAGFLVLAKALREGGDPTAFPLLPAMFFSVLFVLAIYFPEESDPVLERFYLPVLASALAAYALYQLAGFTRREGSLRWFPFAGDLAVITCAAALADCVGQWGRMLVFLGYALVLTVFLLLLRARPLPEEPEGGESPAEPEPEPEEDGEEKEA